MHNRFIYDISVQYFCTIFLYDGVNKMIFLKKNVFKSIPAFILIAALTALSACSGASNPENGSSVSDEADSGSTYEDGANSSVEEQSEKTITVGVGDGIYKKILTEAIKQELENAGYSLNIKEFTDVNELDKSISSGSVDAIYTHTLEYINVINESSSSLLSPISKVHIEKLGLYSEDYTLVDDIPDGASIAIPSDSEYGMRAVELLVSLNLLADSGDLGNDPNYTFTSLNDDTDSNPRGFVISALGISALPSSVKDMYAVVMPCGYAADSGNSLSDPGNSSKAELIPVTVEEISENDYELKTVVIAVKDENKNNEKSQALMKAAESQSVAAYIKDNYKELVIPAK